MRWRLPACGFIWGFISTSYGLGMDTLIFWVGVGLILAAYVIGGTEYD